MSNATNKILVCAISALTTFSVSQAIAQAPKSEVPPMLKRDISLTGKKKVDIAKRYPSLWKVLTPKSGNKQFYEPLTGSITKTQRTARTPRRIATLADGRELWGFVMSKNTWTQDNPEYGLYSISRTAPVSVTKKWDMNYDEFSNYEIPNAGTRIGDGKIGFIYQDTEYAQYGMVFTKYVEHDYTTGDITLESISVGNDIAAFETALDENTGDVYGAFYSSDLSAMEFGKLNFSNLYDTSLDEEKRVTRSTIGTTDKTYLALGLSTDSYLYGVANDGNLYKINTNNGAETLVGATGVANLANTSGQCYRQSGEIDQSTNTFYWACTDINLNTALYTVDLATGKATKISDMPNGESIVGLNIQPAESLGEAPLAASNLEVNFTEGSTTGKIKFTMPTATSDATALSGQKKYEITANGATLLTGSAEAGSEVEKDITVAEGLTTFVVKTYNGEIPGKKSAKTIFVGIDKPKNVAEVKLSINKETAEASLSWDAVTEGVNNGYVGNVSYKIIRYPDATVVKEGLNATSFKETLDKVNLNIYSYGVIAANSKGEESEETKSNYTTFGQVIIPPYTENFNTEQDFNLFTVIDANNDNNIWSYDKNKQWAVSGYSNSTLAADDWLITPAIRLQKNKTYTVRFFAVSGFQSYPEKMEVKYGNGTTVADMTRTLMPAEVLPYQPYGEERIMHEYLLSTDKDEDIHIGFHAVSDADMYRIQLDDISVSAGVSTEVPALAENIKLTPDAGAALKVAVEFNAPTKTISGNELGKTEKMDISVSRDGNEIKKFTDAKPGEKLAFTDEGITENGTHTYTFTASNTNGSGKDISANVYVGEDTPLTPDNRILTDNTTSVRASWDEVKTTGKNNGVVLPANVSYNIYSVTKDEYGYAHPTLLKNTTERYYDIPYNTNEGEMKIMQYAMSAKNAIGESDIMYTSSLLVGKPYDMPVAESFKGGKLNGYWWISKRGYASLYISSDVSSDGDGGSTVMMGGMGNDSIYLNSAKINMNGVAKPTLIFYHKGTPGDHMRILPTVYTPDGKETVLKTIDYSKISGTDDKWTAEQISLEAYKNVPYIIVKLLFIADEPDKAVYVDNIKICDLLDNDITLSIKAPEKIVKGKTNKVDVVVENIGAKDATGFTVSLSANGKSAGSLKETESTLKSFETITYTFDVPVDILDKASVVKLEAKAEYAADEKTSNNETAADVEIQQPTLTATPSVSANAQEGGVEVTWAKIDFDKETITETFDDVPAWTTDNFNGWTTYDADHGMNGSILDGVAYPHEGEEFAYLVFNPEMFYAGLSQTPSFTPHSGNQFLAAFYCGKEQADGQIYIVDADNWLISPKLSGDEQEISFYVSNIETDNANYPETFEVYTSTGGTEIANFSKFGDAQTTKGTDWTKVSVTVPAGTKHIAIRHITSSTYSYVFKIDDITYIKEGEAPKAYNIYRDDVKIATVEAENQAQYVDANAPEGSHRYSVTVVYDEGESIPTYSGIVTGIKSVAADNNTPRVIHSVDGKYLGSDVKNLKQGTYIVNDKKISIK